MASMGGKNGGSTDTNTAWSKQAHG